MESSLNSSQTDPQKNQAKAWRNSTLSNYLQLFLRMASVLVLTRGLFLHLNPEAYGFWALLWSMFGYTLLLDFGFGTAVQKWTSQTRVNGDWARYDEEYRISGSASPCSRRPTSVREKRARSPSRSAPRSMSMSSRATSATASRTCSRVRGPAG